MRKSRFAILSVALTGVLIATACGTGGDVGALPPASPPAASGSPPPPDPEAFRRLAPGWDTDFSKASVSAGEFRSGGPGKDGIPAIDAPKFVTVSEAGFLGPLEPVLAVEVNGDARAYPVQILIWHEIVNDTIGGEPVAVTYCPLCNSSVVFRRTVGDQVLDFGVSGFLRNSDLVMFDRQTESWWQQITGEAIVGAYQGTELRAEPSSTISFADFSEAHPDGKVMSRDTGFNRSYGRNPYVGYDDLGTEPFLYDGDDDDRLDAVDRVVTVEIGAEAVAYAFSRLAGHPVVNDDVGNQPITVFYRTGVVSPLDRSSINDSKDVGAGVAFLRVLDGQELTFEWRDGEFRDVQTRSTWDITGRAVAGQLAGQQLRPLLHGNYFWFSWAAFKPDTRVWQP